MSGNTAKYIMWIAGAVTVAAGIVWWTKRRKDQLGHAELVETIEKGGKKLKHYKGNISIKQRVGLIQDLVWKGVKDPEMRELALAITGKGERHVKVGKMNFVVKGANCTARDGACEAQAIHAWVKDNVRYTGDVGPVKMGRNGAVEAVDFFAAPKRIVEMGGEDCDGHVAVNLTLLALNGFTGKARVTAAAKDEDWSHIYAIAGLPKLEPKKWIALDTTLPNGRAGTEVSFFKKEDFPA